MFGVVPKPLWSRRTPADDQNRILLGLNALVIRMPSALVVIETGLGNKLPPKMREIHQNQELLPASLAAAGIRPEDVTHVLNTHLHFDHCGWNTTLHPDGRVTPTFPNARYFFAAGELAHGRLQLDRDRVSYLSPNYDPLLASGQLTLLDPHGLGGFTPTTLASATPKPPISRCRPSRPRPRSSPASPSSPSPATPPACSPSTSTFRAGRNTPSTPATSSPRTTTSTPPGSWATISTRIRCIEERKRLLARAIPEHWLLIFPHDHQLPATRVTLNDKGRPVADATAPRADRPRS